MSHKQEQDQKAKFGNYHSLDLLNKVYQEKALSLISSLKLNPSPFILELGSADNTFLNLVCHQLDAKGRGLDIVHGDDLEQPLKVKSASTDLVIALEIIEHLYDTDFFLSEIQRVLKPGGYLVLSTPNLASLNNRIRLLLGFYPKYLEYSLQGAGHIHLYTPSAIKFQISNLKFKIIHLVSPNFFCPLITKPWFPKSLRQVFMKLGDLFPNISSHLIVLAQKS